MTDTLQGKSTRKAREQERVGGNKNDSKERHLLTSQPFSRKSASLYYFITHRRTIPIKDCPYLFRVQEKSSTSKERRRGEQHPLHTWSLLCVCVHARANETTQDRAGEGEEERSLSPWRSFWLKLAFWKQLCILQSPLSTFTYSRKKRKQGCESIHLNSLQIQKKPRSWRTETNFRLTNPYSSVVHWSLRAQEALGAGDKWKSRSFILITYVIYVKA